MTKPLATSRLLLALALAILFSCTEIQRDNPLDPDGINFVGYSSSSSDALSSDSSSSGKQDSSSSSEALSSSSSEPSSSGEASSSSANSSSSAVLLPCGTGTYNPDIQFCLNGIPTSLCGGKSYRDYQFCDDEEIYDKCSGKTYDVTKNICCANDWVAVDRYRCCFHEKYEFANSFCYNNNSIEDKCGGSEYDLATHFCDNKTVVEKCGGNKYDPSTHFCHTDGIAYSCGNKPLNPATQFCTKSEVHPEIVPLCEGKGYDTKRKFCHGNTVYDKCGSSDYDPSTHFCHTDGIAYSCGNKPYNPGTQFCHNETAIVDKCDGILEYDPATEQCCGSSKYNPATQFCHTDGTAYSCGSKPYNPATQFCHTDGTAYSCGSKPYDPSIHFCHTDGTTYSCGNKPLDPATQFCYENTIYDKCSGSEYDPATRYCSNGTTKTYGFVTYEGHTYKTVVIGTQTWMAENLNHNVTGSRCYSNQESNCDKYGRLYNWATAMDFNASCNSSICSGQVNPKHRGICPSGWHILSDYDWNVLMAFIHTDKGLGSFTSGISNYAGKYLKATSGWNDYNGSSGNGTNDYGFSALPGGLSGSDGNSFNNVGNYGYWWSASEYAYNAVYISEMYYGSEGADYGTRNKGRLHSIRCVKD